MPAATLSLLGVLAGETMATRSPALRRGGGGAAFCIVIDKDARALSRSRRRRTHPQPGAVEALRAVRAPESVLVNLSPIGAAGQAGAHDVTPPSAQW